MKAVRLDLRVGDMKSKISLSPGVAWVADGDRVALVGLTSVSSASPMLCHGPASVLFQALAEAPRTVDELREIADRETGNDGQVLVDSFLAAFGEQDFIRGCI